VSVCIQIVKNSYHKIELLLVFNDLWLGGNLLVLLMLMELLAIKCCLSFIFINQLHTIPVIFASFFMIPFSFSCLDPSVLHWFNIESSFDEETSCHICTLHLQNRFYQVLFKLYFHKPAAHNSCYFISLFFM
jgi:hypothetical protein